MIPALETAGRWLNTGQTYGWVLYGDWAGHAGQITTTTLLWIGLPGTGPGADPAPRRVLEDRDRPVPNGLKRATRPVLAPGALASA